MLNRKHKDYKTVDSDKIVDSAVSLEPLAQLFHGLLAHDTP